MITAEKVNVEKKSFSQPDQTQTFEKMKVDTVNIGGFTFNRITAEPGWQWSKHLKPEVGTESCQKDHLFYVISGRLGTSTDEGQEEEFGPGEMGRVHPGHDGWAIGDKQVVWLEIPH